MAFYAVKLEQSGRVLIPAAIRKRFGLKPGQDVLISAEENNVTVLGNRAAVAKQIQRELRAYAPERILSEELVAERRADAEAEERR